MPSLVYTTRFIIYMVTNEAIEMPIRMYNITFMACSANYIVFALPQMERHHMLTNILHYIDILYYLKKNPHTH